MSHDEDVERLIELAKRARFHARALSDHRAVAALQEYADELEQQALKLKEKHKAEHRGHS